MYVYEYIRYNTPCIAINAQRQVGSNVLKTMRGLQDTIKELNEGILKDNGYKLIQAYDSSIYIQKSLNLAISTRLISVQSIYGMMNRRDYRTQTISSPDFSMFPHIDNTGCLV